MRRFFQRPRALSSQTAPLEGLGPAPTRDVRSLRSDGDAGSAEPHTPDFADTVVSELSEFEAHALCAREGIPVF